MVTPTVSNKERTKFIFFDVPLSVAIQVMDWPMAMAVLGIARITCTFISSCLRISSQLTPDITEISICFSGLMEGFISSNNLLSCWGSTASTIKSAFLTAFKLLSVVYYNPFHHKLPGQRYFCASGIFAVVCISRILPAPFAKRKAYITAAYYGYMLLCEFIINWLNVFQMFILFQIA